MLGVQHLYRLFRKTVWLEHGGELGVYLSNKKKSSIVVIKKIEIYFGFLWRLISIIYIIIIIHKDYFHIG